MSTLRHSSFRLLLAGELISNFGDGIFLIALPWYVLAHHGGALLLGTVMTAYGAPRTALLIVGGHASDRYRPWTVMLWANCVRGAAVAALAATAASASAHELVLIGVAVVLGSAEGMFIPASEVIVPALLPRRELQAGNALISGTTQLSQLAGPAIGGLLVALVGPAQGFAIDAGTFAISALTLIGVKRDSPAPQAASSSSSRATDATTLRDVLGQPIVRLMLVTDALVNVGSTGMGRVALPALARGPMHLHASGYGALSAAMGAGLLLGTILAASTPPVRRPFRPLHPRTAADRSTDRSHPLHGRADPDSRDHGRRLRSYRDRKPAADHRAAAMGSAPTPRQAHWDPHARQRRDDAHLNPDRRTRNSSHRPAALLPVRRRHSRGCRTRPTQLTNLAPVRADKPKRCPTRQSNHSGVIGGRSARSRDTQPTSRNGPAFVTAGMSDALRRAASFARTATARSVQDGWSRAAA